VIVWPDGSYDVGAASLEGDTNVTAEKLAETKALDRFASINVGQLHKTHPALGAIYAK
jgi:hypothetical protein